MSEALPGPVEPRVVATTVPNDAAPDEVEHLASRFQHFLDRLGLKIPRAACGELLALAPGAPDIDEDRRADWPLCPACVAAKPHWPAAQGVHR